MVRPRCVSSSVIRRLEPHGRGGRHALRRQATDTERACEELEPIVGRLNLGLYRLADLPCPAPREGERDADSGVGRARGGTN